MRRSNFALRLQPSLLDELRKVAESEGVALNQLINTAVAEKLAVLRTEEFFRGRARRANRVETLRILKKAGQGNPPVPGDELPSDWKAPQRPTKTVARNAAKSMSARRQLRKQKPAS
jgi:hypothetical protein